MAFNRTTTVGGKKYRQLVESRWDPEKKQSRIHVIKHLGRVIEDEGKEKLIPSQLKFDSVDHAYPWVNWHYFGKLLKNLNYKKVYQKLSAEMIKTHQWQY